MIRFIAGIVLAAALGGCYHVAPTTPQGPAVDAPRPFSTLGEDTQRQLLRDRTLALIAYHALPGGLYADVEVRKLEPVAGMAILGKTRSYLGPGTHWAVIVRGRWDHITPMRTGAALEVAEAFQATYFYAAATGAIGSHMVECRGTRQVPADMLQRFPPSLEGRMRLEKELGMRP